MEKLSSNLSDNMEGFNREKEDFSRYEISFRRWLVLEIDSGKMSVSDYINAEGEKGSDFPPYLYTGWKVWRY